MNRDKFEELCVEKFGQWREAGNRENDNGAPVTRESLCWRDEQGNYGVLALNAAWWGWQMAMQEVEGASFAVVRQPLPDQWQNADLGVYDPEYQGQGAIKGGTL